MVSIAWTLLSKICLRDDLRSSDPKKSGWRNFATSEVFARPKFWKVFCLIHDRLCTGDYKKFPLRSISPPQKPYLTRRVWLHQSDCDENQTDVTIPYNKLSNLTKWEVSFKWNRKNKSLKSRTTIAYMTPAPRDHYGEWRVDPPVEKAWDMDRSRCQFWQRLALAIIPTLIHEQRALLFYIWSSNHLWAHHFVIGRIPQNCFDFLFHSQVFHLWAWCRNDYHYRATKSLVQLDSPLRWEGNSDALLHLTAQLQYTLLHL